ncbi:MAG: hypothetical protein H6Q14_25 [Bacteroidetes bacterium]|jgi:hypothetical protein|nr:hypothetical protein [Bacteroidota bacterium]
MPETIKKTLRQSQIVFIITFLVGIVLFVGTTFLRLREILHGNSPHLLMERYGILLTLIGIPVSFKIYQYFISKIVSQPENSKLDFYIRIYFLRLTILGLVLVFDAVGLYITGSRNFFYMVFITLVTFLFCLPNKSEILTLCERKSDIPS